MAYQTVAHLGSAGQSKQPFLKHPESEEQPIGRQEEEEEEEESGLLLVLKARQAGQAGRAGSDKTNTFRMVEIEMAQRLVARKSI